MHVNLLSTISVFSLVLFSQSVCAQKLSSDVPYAENAEKLQVLDIHEPAEGTDLPVVFWIHGGGWVTGDKKDVQIKPQVFTKRGYVFVSTNYRLLPDVEMEDVICDVAKSLAYVHKHIEKYRGDPSRIFVMGHSAGAQLAALLCTDDRYLKAEDVSFHRLKGCVPVDGDTYDVPAIIMTAETRQAVHHLPPPKYGHRVKFGNDPKKHVEFSAVTHVAEGKAIPPFLILHVAGSHDVTARAQRFASVLASAEVPVKTYAAKDTNHNQLNANLGVEGDAATNELFTFLVTSLKQNP